MGFNSGFKGLTPKPYTRILQSAPYDSQNEKSLFHCAPLVD